MLVVSDQALAGVGYQVLLKSAAIARIEIASGVDHGIDIVGASHWDLVILDLSTQISSASALAALLDCSPELPILVMGEVAESQVARSMLKAGARGYFDKAESATALRSAVQTVLGGRRYIGSSLAQQMQSDGDDDWRKAPHERLSAREREVFERLATGTPASVIGRELSLSVKTVSTYRTRLLQKMGFTSNADIISYAMRNGLVR